MSQDFDTMVLFIAIVVVSIGFIALEVLDESRERQRELLDRDDLEKQRFWREMEQQITEHNYLKDGL